MLAEEPHTIIIGWGHGGYRIDVLLRADHKRCFSKVVKCMPDGFDPSIVRGPVSHTGFVQNFHGGFFTVSLPPIKVVDDRLMNPIIRRTNCNSSSSNHLF